MNNESKDGASRMAGDIAKLLWQFKSIYPNEWAGFSENMAADILNDMAFYEELLLEYACKEIYDGSAFLDEDRFV